MVSANSIEGSKTEKDSQDNRQDVSYLLNSANDILTGKCYQGIGEYKPHLIVVVGFPAYSINEDPIPSAWVSTRVERISYAEEDCQDNPIMHIELEDALQLLNKLQIALLVGVC